MSAEEISPLKPLHSDQRVSVVGVGGAGNNLLSHAIGDGLSPNQCVAVNTDRSQLSRSPARSKVLLWNEAQNGHLNGSFEHDGSNKALEALRLSVHRVVPFTEPSDMTIVVAGLGGETGTGAAPLIAQYSRTHVRPVVSVVTIPFIHEKSRRLIALRGLKKMVEASDCTIVIDNSVENDRLSPKSRRADQLACLAVSGLSSLASQMEQAQRQEFRRIISLGPIATLCSAPVVSSDRIERSVFAALKNPSARLPISRARGGILLYTGPGQVSRGHAAMAYDTLASLAGHDLEFTYASLQSDMDPAVCVLLTGYDYGSTVRAFVDFIEDLYDVEYGGTENGSLVRVGLPLFQMEQS